MSVLRSMDKLPDLNRATVLLVSTEDALLQQLAESMLKDDCASELRVLQKVEEFLQHVDSSFFLGKVCFLVTGGGKLSCSHGAASGAHSADLRWPCARRLRAEPDVLAAEPREPPIQGAVSITALHTFAASSKSSHCW
ncbi:centromere protein M isoform X4 [Mus musculus]|uniref:centromere protein M isoform X4 n=1 Tax=Mus musculus TaxID=10090 RepID=UPI0011AE70C0|nr:centromere protein M isoform X4 [Mus musculus]